MTAKSTGRLPRLVAQLRGDGIRGRLARGTFWSGVNLVGSRIANLALGILLARVLGPDSFGRLGMVQSTLGMFGMIAALGTGATATKYVAEHRLRDPAKAGRILALAILTAGATSIFVGGALLAAASPLATRSLAAPDLVPLLRVGVGLLLFRAISGAFLGGLAGFEAFRELAFLEILTSLLQAVLAFGGALVAGVMGAVVGLVVALAIQAGASAWILIRVASRNGVVISYRHARRELRVLYDFALPSLFSGIVAAGATWAAHAYLVNQPDGYREMGLFNAANQWRTAIMFLPITLSSALLPVLSSMFGSGDERHRRVLWVSVGFNAAAALLAALAVTLAAPWILAAYGEGFRDSYWVLLILAGAAAFAAITTAIGQALTAMGRIWVGLGTNLFWAGSLIGLVIVLGDRGALGLSLAHLGAYGLHFFVTTGLTFALQERWRNETKGEAGG